MVSVNFRSFNHYTYVRIYSYYNVLISLINCNYSNMWMFSVTVNVNPQSIVTCLYIKGKTKFLLT